ncbi:MAG: hypothetical protein WC905_02010, partial [Patescibacteria group bacterium]
GVLIDVSQVVMLSFVNAFKDVGSATLLDGLGISDILTFTRDNQQSDFWVIVGAYVLGLIYVIIAIIVIAAMLAMLAMRLVMIWIYVVLSPLAYLLSAFPGGSKYAGQWWSQFTQNLIVGPVLAFFIWLSFATLQQGSQVKMTDQNSTAQQEQAYYFGKESASSTAVTGTKASTPEALINFVIAIGLLIGGLKIAQEVGGAAAGVAGKVSAGGFGFAKKVGKSVGGWALRATKNRLGDLRDVISEKTHVDWNVAAGYKRYRQQVEENREQRRTRIRKNTLKEAAEGETWMGRKMALFSTGDVAFQNIQDRKFFRGGDPEIARKALKELEDKETQKKTSQDRISDLNAGNNRILTVAELQVNQAEIAKLDAANNNLAQQKDNIINNAEYQDLLQKKEAGTLTGKEKTKFEELNKEIDGIDQTMDKNDAAAEELSFDPSKKVSASQFLRGRKKALELDTANKKLGEEREQKVSDTRYQELLQKEEAKRLSPEERKEFRAKKSEIDKIDSTMHDNENQAKALRSQYVLASDDKEKEKIILGNKRQIYDEQQKSGQLDKEITELGDVLRKNKLSDIESARADINASMESEASKKIANFSNPDQLVSIFKEAVEQKDEALIAACYKKLAKTGNYNEIHRDLGIGTGYEGMIAMEDYLKDKGGMTEQDSRALIAEVGEICKAVNHFEAFGAMTMNKAGQWERTGKDQQEAGILSEKSKIQVQQYVRTSNRLGNGSYRNNQPHTAENWDISRSTIALFASKDAKYSEEMAKTGNINAIQFIGANKENLKRLRDAGANEVAKTIEDICRKTTADVSNPVNTIRNIKM